MAKRGQVRRADEELLNDLDALKSLGEYYGPFDCWKRTWPLPSGGHITVFEDPCRALENGECIIWPAGLVLAKYLEIGVTAQALEVQDKTVLELGAGLGLTAMVAATLGAKQVFATEHPSCMDWLLKNVNYNQFIGPRLKPLALDWGERVGEGLPPSTKVDLILGADLFYEAKLHGILLTALAQLSDSTTVILFAHDDASTPLCSKMRTLFFDKLVPEAGFAVHHIDTALLVGTGFWEETVHLYRLSLKAPSEDVTEIAPSMSCHGYMDYGCRGVQE